MKTSRASRIGWVALGIWSASVLVAQEEAAEVDRLPRAWEWTFHLLPKAFQSNPSLEVTVMTEMTPAGRLLPMATPDTPVYVQLVSGGAQELGAPCSTKLADQPTVEHALLAALARNGYLPAVPAHPPTLLVVYSWGMHNALDRDLAAMFPELDLRQRMERVQLIGGAGQIRRMRDAAEWGESIMNRDTKYEFLRDQALDDLYFAVASAYDYRALAAGQRRLLWRTKMTVAGAGVSPVETLRPMIATAAPFFGREMPEPAIGMPHLRHADVKIGPLVVIETDIAPPPVSAGKPAKKP